MGNDWDRWWGARGEPGQPPPDDARAHLRSEMENERARQIGVGRQNDETPRDETDPERHAESLDDRATRRPDDPSAEMVAEPDTLTGDRGWPDDRDFAGLDLRALPRPARTGTPRRGRRLARPGQEAAPTYNPQQRLMILDAWLRSGLPAGDFAPLLGLSKHTLYSWKKRFAELGPAGLMEQPRGARQGSRLPELTKRAILLLKQAHPDWGCERISHMLLRGPALPASPKAVAHALHEAGYELHETPTRPHPDKIRHFERARANQLWQTDLFTFVLKRQNRRVYLVAFLDDHSRYVVSFGLHASQSAALVLEVFRAGVAAYGTPEEVLTDNGSQYVTWRGESAFHKELVRRGVQHIVAAPRHPQTLGKIERFWGTLWRECLETAVFLDLADARARIGHFIDSYNFQRVHSGIDGLVPADRFFGAAPDMLRALKERVAANALELARNGVPRPPFYVAGQLGGKTFSLHAEGERVYLTGDDGARREVDLVPPAPGPSAGAVVMPAAVCPDGSPTAEAPANETAEAAGQKGEQS